jgi:glycosyltransferase 2 family protein
MNVLATAQSNIFSRPWFRLLIRLGGSILALGILFHFLSRAEVWRTIRHLPAHLWLLVIAGYLGTHLIAINKWRMMVNVAGARLTFRQAARFYFSGLFSTLFLPSIVGGDLVRGAMALNSGQSRASIFMGGVMDRTLDFSALAFLIVLGAVFIPGAVPSEARRIFLSAGITLLILVALVAPALLWFPVRKLSLKWRRGVVRLRRSARSMRRSPYHVAAALCLGLLAQTSFVWLTSIVAHSSGLHLPFRAWLFAWPLAKLSALIPISQGGIGVREAALVVLLVPFGARPYKTAAVGLAWEAVIISGGLIAALIALLLGRFPASAYVAPRTEPAAENSSPSKLESL